MNLEEIYKKMDLDEIEDKNFKIDSEEKYPNHIFVTLKSSDGKRNYEVMLSKEYGIWCGCAGFYYNKACKHLKFVIKYAYKKYGEKFLTEVLGLEK
jgi:hypothetical protein